MALVPKIDPNKIFASDAPTQDKPAAFDNYEKGMDETRKNLGRPTIPQLNYLHQTADQKILWIHQNGGGLPYDASIEYAETAVTLKDGELKQLVGGAWVEVKTKSLPATAITTASSQNQQQINDFGGAKWYAKVGGYNLGATVKLDNGDTAQSTIPNNTVNPNVNMAGWMVVSTITLISVVDMLAIANPKNGQRVFVKSRDVPNYALENPYAGGGDFVFKSASSSISNGGTVFDATGGKWMRVYSESPKVSWFAGHGGTGDKSERVQQAIDFANNLNDSCELIVDAMYDISSSLFIDRLTDTTHGEFYIIGENGGGFRIGTAITVFSSRNPYNPSLAPAYTKAPCSEFTTFKNIHFESTIQNIDCAVFDSKFLRLTFIDCIHHKIRGCKSAEYLQSVRWFNCRIRQHLDFFVNCADAYDVRSEGHQFENAAKGFNFSGIARGCHFDNGLYQGCTSPFLQATGFFGGSVSKNYFEENGGQDIRIGVGGGNGGGFEITNNFWIVNEALAGDYSFYAVDIGAAVSATITGNNCNASLCDTSQANLFGLNVGGNGVSVGKRIISHDPKIAKEIIPAQSSTQVGATPLRNHANIINSSPSTNAAVRLPKLSDFMNGDSITIINNTTNLLNIYPDVDERILGVAYNSQDQIGNGSVRYYKSGSDYWIKA